MKATVLLQPPVSRKEEEEVHGITKQEAATAFHSNLELRLGMSVGNGCGGDHLVLMDHQKSSTTSSSTESRGAPYQKRRCFAAEKTAPARSCFVDPWSLAARQEKAALEQAIKQSNPSSSMPSRSINPPPPCSVPAVVGWPPVRSFRRNLGAPPPQQQTKSSAEKPQKEAAAQEKEEEEEVVKLQTENTVVDDDGDGVNNNKNKNKNKKVSNTTSSSSMFVKVNMEGYAVGRKIDLKAHHCYDSLSKALQQMFHNLLSAANYSNKSWKQDKGDEVVVHYSPNNNNNYVLLYEDIEGDKMLVGDVPWEMFISSVKRLYISLDQRK